MPGGSPYFADVPAIERLYEDLEKLFQQAQGHFTGKTLAEMADTVS